MEKLLTGAASLELKPSQEQIERFELYYRELVEWNKRVNLTRITGYEDVQVRHFLDSLTALAGFPEATSGKTLRIIDVGSGAGLPGLPLRIVRPDICLVLMEVTAKKAEFLQHIIDILKLGDVEVVNERAETAAHDSNYREQFDVVVTRALAPLTTLAELTLPFAAVGGRVIALKKGDISDEIASAARAIETLGGEKAEVVDIRLDELPDKRCLVSIAKVAPTPPSYPRRPGIPAKRPLL